MDLKQEEERLRILKSLIREEQESLDLKRIVWTELGVVGEFKIYKVYDYNHEELNELLYNVGLLPLVTFIKNNVLSEMELGALANIPSQRKRYLRFTPSNLFKKTENIPLFKFKVDEISLFDKVAMWKESNNRFVQLNNIWQSEKLRAVVSLELETSKRFTFEFGTFSLLESPLNYRTDNVLELFNEKTIFKCARINLDSLDEIRAKGFIKKQELNGIRRVVDVQKRYILMTIQKEKAMRDYFYSRIREWQGLS
ncbi:hypothetical protein [Paenibacillus guangzhouensis]|uniref:hypothetical protein n=1 Tax=Paenibacillus guangzhouensis TaxID=1473112 RepID=UPI0012668BFD|nr:hypothetical protein [Paenibacillus guangzhouensis]